MSILGTGTDKLTSRLVKFSVFSGPTWPPHNSKTQRHAVGELDSVWPISNAITDWGEFRSEDDRSGANNLSVPDERYRQR